MTAVLGLAAEATTQAAGAPPGLSAKSADQIAVLQRIKASLSPAERKLDSRLVITLRQRQGKQATAGVPALDTGVSESKSGTTEVDIRARSVTSGLLGRLREAGVQVRHASKEHASIRAGIPLSAVERVASWRDVLRIEVAGGAITGHQTGPVGVSRPTEPKEERAARVEAEVRAALAEPQATVVSEGDKAHAADVARTRHRVTGVGVKICALADGVNSLVASQASGELPAVDVLPGQAGNGNEGTAMLELLHDVAPNAKLGFATAFTSLASFADNIRALRFRARCDILVDDVLYFAESPFQDGPIAQSVNAVTADGAMYFSSAGNEGNTLDGTSGNYEADFVDSGRPAGKFVGTAHDFDPADGVQIFEPISDASNANVPVTLFWADAMGAAANDYDLYLFDGDGDVVALSQDVQDGDDDPFEFLFTPFFGGGGFRLAVVKYAGSARYLQLSALRGRFKDSPDGLVARVSPGVIRGHAAAVNAFGTAAAPAAMPLPFDLEPGDPPNPSGPFPNPFTAAQLPERFTSDGPRRVFFNADGTPITPGNFTSTGGAVRRKPDVTAADGVSTSVRGFSPFFGTSAAAPHAAAIAGLVLSGNPGAATADTREAFEATTLDLTPAGFDNRAGAGILRADRVLAHTGATPQPLVEAQDPTITPVTGDGDAFLEPGERASVALPVKNVGDGTATGVSVTLSDSDSQTTIAPRARPYGNVAPGTTKSQGFSLTLASTYPLGKPLSLAARVTFAGVLSPTTKSIKVRVGEPATTPTTFAYSGPPVAIPDFSQVGASVTIPIAGFGYASKLTFSIDGDTCTDAAGATTVGLDHTFVGDLVGTLTAPDGRTVLLFQNTGFDGNNLCRAVFDDAAERPFAAATASQAPFTGSWRPAAPLSELLTAPVDGTWTFKVVDTEELDTGSIRAVSLQVTGFVSG